MTQDPWLQQALRHAPDHDVAVPEAVRDTILNAARAAVRQPQAQPARRWWQGLLAPLSQPARLGYSGAFMALLVVGLWGLDRLGPPAVAPEQATALTVPAAVAPASPAAASPATPAPPARAPQAAAVAAPLALKATESAESRRMAVAAKADAGAQSKRQAREEAPPVAEMVAAKPAPAAAPVAVPAPSPVALDAPPAAAAAAVAPAGLAAPRVDATSLAHAMPSKAAPSPPARDKAVASAAEPANPLAAMLGALRQADGARWQTAQARGEHGLAQDQWLAGVQRASAGLWHAAVAPPEGAPSVQWLGPDGGQLWLLPTGQVWLAWHGQVYVARLPEAEASALRAQLAEWR
jgi:hypothetical protein